MINANEHTSLITIGYRGEKNAEVIEFDFSEWYEKYGPGSICLLLQRHGDKVIYPVELEVEGTVAKWTVSATDTALHGTGKATLQYTVGDVIKKGKVFHFTVGDSLLANGEAPEPYSNYVDQVLQAADTAAESARSAAESAEAASHYAPYQNDLGQIVFS